MYNNRENKVEIRQISDKEIWIGENRYYLDEDNILYITPVGKLDEKIALAVKEACLKLMNMVEGKIKVFVDLNKAGEHSSKARKIVREISENEKVGKTAVFGIHPVARVIASIGMREDMCFFKTKEEALAWLKER